jgi:hypothetical protein
MLLLRLTCLACCGRQGLGFSPLDGWAEEGAEPVSEAGGDEVRSLEPDEVPDWLLIWVRRLRREGLRDTFTEGSFLMPR